MKLHQGMFSLLSHAGDQSVLVMTQQESKIEKPTFFYYRESITIIMSFKFGQKLTKKWPKAIGQLPDEIALMKHLMNSLKV